MVYATIQMNPESTVSSKISQTQKRKRQEHHELEGTKLVRPYLKKHKQKGWG
jgi:hypothetical protein